MYTFYINCIANPTTKVPGLSIPSYAAPKRTDTNFETPGSCMVTP